MGSILGSKGNDSSSNSTSNSNSVGRSGNYQGSFSTTGTQFNNELGQLIGRQMGSGSDYSKEAALKDVNGVMANQARTALEGVMPNIARNVNQSGAYNSTTKQLLQDNAQAQIMGQLANTQLQAVKDYGNINAQNNSSLANLFNAGQVSNSGSVGLGFNNSNTNAQSNSQSEASGGGSGILGFFADGGIVPTPGDSGGEGFMAGMDMSQLAGAFLDAGTGGMFKAITDLQGGFNAKTLMNLIRVADGKPPINWDDPVKKANPDENYDSAEWLLNNINSGSTKSTSGIGTPVVVKGQ